MDTRQHNIKMIGFDLDDTALNSNKELTPEVSQAIQDAIKSGITVLPATGRQITGIPPEILAIPGIRYALVANGAAVYDLGAEKRIYSNSMPAEQAKEILEKLRKYNCMITMYTDNKSFSEDFDLDLFEGLITPGTVEYLRTSRNTVPSLEQLLETRFSEVDKFSVHFTDFNERLKAMEYFGAMEEIATSTSIPTNIEINAGSANKGVGLLMLAETLGIGKAEVMAVGDNVNDIEMLKAVGYSVAMKNAPDHVKYAADAVTTKTCDQNGLAEAIRSVMPGGTSLPKAL